MAARARGTQVPQQRLLWGTEGSPAPAWGCQQGGTPAAVVTGRSTEGIALLNRGWHMCEALGAETSVLALPWLNHGLSPGPATLHGIRECRQPLGEGVAPLSPQKYRRQKGPPPVALWLLERLFQGSRSVLSSFLLRAQKRPAELRGVMMMGASGEVRMGVVSDVVSSASLSTSSKLSLTEGMICTTFS